MKTYYATITVLAMTLLPSICTLAQEGSVAVPGTADAPLPSGMSPQAERQAIKTEMAKVPLGPIMGMHAPDRDSEGITITSAGVHIENGQPAWYIGAVGKCGGTVPTPKQQAAVRAYFAKYTTAEVRFEKGRMFSISAMPPIKGCD